MDGMWWIIIAGLIIGIIFAVWQASSGEIGKAVLGFLISVIIGVVTSLIVKAVTTTDPPPASSPGTSSVHAISNNSDSVEWGPWSEWSQTPVTGSATRQVETETRYRYQIKETMTSTDSNIAGWTLEDVIDSAGEWGPWSDWSPDFWYIQEDSNTDVDTPKTQYSYCTVSNESVPSEWGPYSDWQDSYVAADYYTDVRQQTVYAYYYFQCPSCGAHMHVWDITCPTWAGGCGNAYIPESSWHVLWSTTSHDEALFQDWHGTGKYYAYIDGNLVFKWTDGMARGEAVKTQYQYRTRTDHTVTYEGNWSPWSDTPYYESDTTKVKTQTVYRYRIRTHEKLYYYYRILDWSDWTNVRQYGDTIYEEDVATFYRYQDAK